MYEMDATYKGGKDGELHFDCVGEGLNNEYTLTVVDLGCQRELGVETTLLHVSHGDTNYK